jgi:DNA-binding HxlR family transcriptional regulator
MKRNDQRSLCPINLWLELLGDRWSLLIVRDLLLGGPRTYGELLAADERIATNTLADRLTSLTAAGIVEQRVIAGRSRHLYALTEKGFELLPILLEMVLWGERHYTVNATGRELARRYREDPGALVEEILRRQGAPAKGGDEGGDPTPPRRSDLATTRRRPTCLR